jgi:hypothetical protein
MALTDANEFWELRVSCCEALGSIGTDPGNTSLWDRL